jgi:hypothetical protein
MYSAWKHPGGNLVRAQYIAQLKANAEETLAVSIPFPMQKVAIVWRCTHRVKFYKAEFNEGFGQYFVNHRTVRESLDGRT